MRVQGAVLKSQRPVSVPETVLRSPLMKRGGFGVFAGLVDGGIGEQLLAEALHLYASAVPSEIRESDAEERGGRPARRFLNVSGGPVQRQIYNAPDMLAFLRQLTHRPIEPTGELGTYSYYSRPGDFLAIHRDIVTCDVAVITCLNDSPDHAAGGALCLYPDRMFEPVAAIRTTPSKGAHVVRLRKGQTIALFGGLVPHALLPVDADQVRIVSVLCYRIP